MARDGDLNPVLAAATNEELDPLVRILLTAATERLSSDKFFRMYSPDHRKYVDSIAREIRLFGGHSMANLLRGDGPAYAEVAADVAGHMHVPFTRGTPAPGIENAILLHLGEAAWREMAPPERGKWAEGLGLSLRTLSGDFPAFSFGQMLSLGKGKAYDFAMGLALPFVENYIGKSAMEQVGDWLSEEIRKIVLVPAAMKFVATMGEEWNLAGPAFRVTVPCVLYVAALRRRPRN